MRRVDLIKKLRKSKKMKNYLIINLNKNDNIHESGAQENRNSV